MFFVVIGLIGLFTVFGLIIFFYAYSLAMAQQGSEFRMDQEGLNILLFGVVGLVALTLISGIQLGRYLQHRLFNRNEIRKYSEEDKRK